MIVTEPAIDAYKRDAGEKPVVASGILQMEALGIYCARELELGITRLTTSEMMQVMEEYNKKSGQYWPESEEDVTAYIDLIKTKLLLKQGEKS